jgi:glycosyltransferase involved in cell wall biosynthesis
MIEEANLLPGISLIIPVYNASLYLREAIDSVLNQTLRPRQIILVDDGSTDDSLAITRSYGDAITVIAQANGGTGAARNRGIAHANQPMIAFLDNDDRFVPHKLERQLETLLEQPEALLCVCRSCAFWSPEVPKTARTRADLTAQFRKGQPGTWLARRELFEHAGVFSVEPECYYIEGSELFTRIENTGCAVAHIDDMLIEHRLSLLNKTADSKGHLDGIMTLLRRRLHSRGVCV